MVELADPQAGGFFGLCDIDVGACGLGSWRVFWACDGGLVARPSRSWKAGLASLCHQLGQPDWPAKQEAGYIMILMLNVPSELSFQITKYFILVIFSEA